MCYSKGLKALKVLLSHPWTANEGVHGRRWLSLRGRLRATFFWKAWRCSRCLTIWQSVCMHLRLRRDQQRAAWTEFERDTTRSACRAAVRIATRSEVRATSERSAVLNHVLVQWKKMVVENKLLRYSGRNVKGTENKIENISRAGFFCPQNILSQGGSGEGRNNHNQSILGSREQPRRSLPPPLPLLSQHSESPYGPAISYQKRSSINEEAFERWRVPPRPFVPVPPATSGNRSFSLLSFQPTTADISNDLLTPSRGVEQLELELMRSRSEETAISRAESANDSELRKQLAREVLVLLQEISRCI